MTLLFLMALVSTAFADLPVADLPYEDGSFGCFEQKTADRYLNDFSVNVKSFGGLELCDGSKDTKKLLNDLYLIDKSEFAAPAEHPFIRGLVDRNQYYSWMKSQTRGVRRGHDIPYATAYNSFGYFTMQDGWASLSTLGRVGTIIHEARHTAGYRHYGCTSGPYANSGVSGCDTSFSQGGSHAVEMEYYARVVLESKNLHPVYKSMARLMALGRSNFVFNEMPMRQRQGLAALKGDRVILADGGRITEHAIPTPSPRDRLKRTSFGASLFDGVQARAVDFYGPSGNLSDDYSYFKLFQIPRDRAPATMKAVEEIDLGNLRYFAVLSEEGKVFSYNFPEGEWHPGSAPVAGAGDFVTVTPSGKTGLFVVKSDGAILPFDLRTRRYETQLLERWPADTAAYAFIGQTLVALKADGNVVDAQTGGAIPGFQGVTDLVNVPLYDAFEVAR